jgi:hypothetical protein
MPGLESFEVSSDPSAVKAVEGVADGRVVVAELEI